MAVSIDILSVATQGFFELPSSPTIEPSRDALRIGTLGWIIIDFSLIPNADDPTFAQFASALTDATVDNPFTVCLSDVFENVATFEDGTLFVSINNPYVQATIADAVGDIEFSVPATAPTFELGSLELAPSLSDQTASIEPDPSVAVVQPSETTGD